MRSDPDMLTTMRLHMFMQDYGRCIDEDELERWPSFFVDDCTYKVTTRENVDAGYPAGLIYADSKAMLNDRVKSLREINIYEKQRYRHVIGMPYLAGRGADGEVRAQTGFIVVRVMHDGDTQLFATGVYRDLLLVDDQSISLRERIVVCDSSRIDTLLAYPL